MTGKVFHIFYHPYAIDPRPQLTVYDYRRHEHPTPHQYTPTPATLNRIGHLTYHGNVSVRTSLTVAGGYDIFIRQRRK